MAVKFQDNSIKVKSSIESMAVAYLHEAAGEVVSQAQRNTSVQTGQLKGSWTYKVDETNKKATIGSPLENAIWEEFGTGEYALKGNGRKGGWTYKDENGEWYHTMGKPPKRALWNAFKKLKPTLVKMAEKTMKGIK